MKASARVAVALAVAVFALPTLAGCGSIEGLIEQATGGEVNVSIGSLPDGWPTEVPVIDGEIIGGGVVENSEGQPVFNVTVKVAEGAFAEIQSQLAGAGFEQELDGGDTITSGAFSNGTWGVLVAVSGSDDAFVANYTVTEGDPTAQ